SPRRSTKAWATRSNTASWSTCPTESAPPSRSRPTTTVTFPSTNPRSKSRSNRKSDAGTGPSSVVRVDVAEGRARRPGSGVRARSHGPVPGGPGEGRDPHRRQDAALAGAVARRDRRGGGRPGDGQRRGRQRQAVPDHRVAALREVRLRA